MGVLKLLFIGLFLATFKVSGQAPAGISVYLKSNRVSEDAKDFYNGKFRASDDNKTLSILDSLNTTNNFTRPFYIYLVSKMMDKADGALSEVLGITGKKFIENHPDNAIDFLYSTRQITDKKFISLWAEQIAGEFMINCEGIEKLCIKKSLQQTLLKTKLENKPKLIQFFNQISMYCH